MSFVTEYATETWKVCIRYRAPRVLGRVATFVIKATEQGKSQGSCHIKK